jgi:hypothetical protein
MSGANGVEATPTSAAPGSPPALNGIDGSASALAAVNGSAAPPVGDDDEVPHARGPPEIGIEDTGPMTGTGGVAGLGGAGEASEETAMSEGEG